MNKYITTEGTGADEQIVANTFIICVTPWYFHDGHLHEHLKTRTIVEASECSASKK